MELENKTIYCGEDEWTEACITRTKSSNKIRTSISFIDDVTNGGFIYDDFVLISADSGIGKTEYGCMLAENFARNNKRVLYFGLELTKGEGLNRIAFRNLTKIVKENEEKPVYMDYGVFKSHKLDHYILAHKQKFDESIKVIKDNISWRRKDPNFDLMTLKKELIENKDKFDVFIVDHLSMIFTEGENENKEVYNIIKEIDYFCTEYEKPIILIVHIRKDQGATKTYMPRLHDILGTKHIVNIPKRIIMLSRDYETKVDNGRYPTFCRMLKNRDDGKTNYTARIIFNQNNSEYEQKYEILHDKGNGKEVVKIEHNEIPFWAKNAVGGRLWT